MKSFDVGGLISYHDNKSADKIANIGKQLEKFEQAFADKHGCSPMAEEIIQVIASLKVIELKFRSVFYSGKHPEDYEGDGYEGEEDEI